ncbi:MAG: TPM domain-containing protein [Actinomycetota bacterium]|nr:TPM domain-containing protein [Actinomycetota bacterium]
MRLKSRFFIFAFAFLFLAAAPIVAAGDTSGPSSSQSAQQTVLPANPSDYVMDLAGIIDANTASRIDALLKELEEKTGAQVVVLTVPSLNGQDIEQFSVDTGQKWGLGQKGKDNGFLFVVAPNERKYWFSTGYGLEGTLPDSYLGTLGRQVLVPAFKAGQYSQGIEQAVGVVAQRIASRKGITLTGVPQPQQMERQRASFVPLIFGGLFFLLIIISAFRGGLPLILYPLLFGGGGWGGGGGFGGGFGGGGFGGGGGGSFGGGGAGGSW